MLHSSPLSLYSSGLQPFWHQGLVFPGGGDEWSFAHYWSLSGCVAQFLTGHIQMLVCGPRDGDSCSTVKGTYQDLSKLRGDQKER